MEKIDSKKIEKFCKAHQATITIGCTVLSTAVGIIFKVKKPTINLNCCIKDLPIGK